MFLNGDIAEKITKTKQQEGPDLHVFGSANLVQTLLKHDLVDALWLKIFPITLGGGKRLFADGTIPSAALSVSASVSQCQDAQCNGQTVLSSQNLALVPEGSTNTLSAVWDHPNHQFIFRLNNDAPVSLAYRVPDSFPPGSADKSFFVFGQVPHCTATPRPLASMDARFGNVYVNP